MKSIALGPGGAQLRYLEFAGDGPPLMIVHGLGCASSFEYPHVARAPALSARHVLLSDLFGSGYSDHHHCRRQKARHNCERPLQEPSQMDR